MPKVIIKTMNGVYHLGCTNKLSNELIIEIMSAVKNDSDLGVMFLVSNRDMILN
jgi:hypothetical protein